jgi:hypothetical protein
MIVRVLPIPTVSLFVDSFALAAGCAGGAGSPRRKGSVDNTVRGTKAKLKGIVATPMQEAKTPRFTNTPSAVHRFVSTQKGIT